MTIEEKAKAYDEALKKMQPLYEQAKKDDNPIWSTYEYLFPQICESEDERIRKEIVSALKFANVGGVYDKHIAYLEKQKDASKVIEAVERIDKYIDEHLVNAYDMKDYNPEKKYYCGWDDALGKIAGILQDVYSNEKQKVSLKDFIDNFPYSAQKEQKSVEIHIDNPNIQKVDPNIKITTSDSSTSCNELPYMSNESYRIDYLDEKQKKQKPSERIEMKKSLSDTVITELSKYNGENYWKSPWAMDSTGLQYPLYFANLGATWQKEQKPAEQLGGTFTSYDIAKTFTEGQNYVIAHPEKFGLCKPAEWSEEDKEMLDAMIDIVSNSLYEPLCPREGMLAWLKFLRPQPHWKPSEEQMDALKDVAYGTYQNGDGLALRSLYEQLKKLM